MSTSRPVLLTVNEVSRILRIARQKVYILIETGAIHGTKVGNDWRVRLDSIEEMIGPVPDELLAASRGGQLAA